MRGHLRRLATAGNAVALGLLVMVLANADLWRDRPAPALGIPKSPILVVIIDALRLDCARDPAVMPNLVRLGQARAAGVESWIPSTVAGIRTIVEGNVPPPVSFFHDFRAPRSKNGGIFAAAKAAGLRTFAAGPRLWADLYGPWLDGSVAVATIGGDDEQVVRAGITALGDHDLVAVHLSGPDDAAHLYGGDSPQYRQALRRADAALGRLLARAGPERAIVVTSDHGVTDRGGHAGPEPEVVRVPVVFRGLRSDGPGELRQRDVFATGRAPSLGAPPVFLVPLFVLACLWLIARRLIRGGESRRAPFLLNAALWIALLLIIAGFPGVALGIAGASLVVAPFLVPDVPVRPPARAGAELALTAGLAWGALRLLDGHLPPWSLMSGLLTVGALGVAAGLLLQRLFASHPLATGVLGAILPTLLLRLLGETASLSTLDVRLAFRVAAGPLGLPGAVATVLFTQALPAVTLLLGMAPALARSHPDAAGRFAGGLALALSAQAALAGAVLPVQGPLALGLLVRLIGETTFLFLGSAAVLALGGVRTRPARSRTPAATPP